MDPRLEELLGILYREMEALGVDYAIGGALAMSAHGYRRFTSDVDLFIHDESRGKVLRAFRQAGLQVSEIGPGHFIALNPQHRDFDIRIDILIPVDEPGLSAVEHPERLSIVPGGALLNVMGGSLLAMMKFYSDRQKDLDDLRAMARYGIFDPSHVRALVASIDPEGLVEWDAIANTFRDTRQGPARPKGRLPRKP
jgi:hypothetical protein